MQLRLPDIRVNGRGGGSGEARDAVASPLLKPGTHMEYFLIFSKHGKCFLGQSDNVDLTI